MTVAVNDANIFIDLFEVELIDKFFELKLDLHTTNLVINELDLEQQDAINKHSSKSRLTIKNLSTKELSEIQKTEAESGKLSQQDLSVQYYAGKLKAMILTGDKRLRSEAKKNGFEVHGILWVFEQLMGQGIIKPKLAIEKLEALMKINTWLPMEECNLRIEKWKKL